MISLSSPKCIQQMKKVKRAIFELIVVCLLLDSRILFYFRKISCNVRIRHISVPTETVQLSSDPFYAGIEITAESSTRVIEEIGRAHV